MGNFVMPMLCNNGNSYKCNLANIAWGIHKLEYTITVSMHNSDYITYIISDVWIMFRVKTPNALTKWITAIF